MQRIARVNHPNANANANASLNAGNEQLFIFLSLHLRLLPTRVNRQKLNRCRPSWKNTSTALPYLSFFAFALDVWTRLHFHLRLRLHLHCMYEPWNDMIVITELNTFSIWQLAIFLLCWAVPFSFYDILPFQKKMISRIQGLHFGLFC